MLNSQDDAQSDFEIALHASPSLGLTKMGPLYSSYISASAKERPARGKLLLLKNRREHNLDSSIFPSSMKLAFLVILLALEVFGEETELISDALVEEGINQLTSEISEDELKTLGQAGTIDFS